MARRRDARGGRLSSVVVLYATAAVGAALIAACVEDEALTPSPWCPNRVPEPGTPCEPGLVCSYVDPSGCAPYFIARCNQDGVWELDDECTPTGGNGGLGGVGGAGATGGAGGMGGNPGGQAGSGGGCVDPVPGPPTVTSPTVASYPPDATYGKYRVEFSEPVTSVSSNLAWTGPGSLNEATKVGPAAYDVIFSDLPPGSAATLTVETGPQDGCGNQLDSAVTIDISLQPSCHLLVETFEGDFLNGGWSTIDNEGDGNQWARNDQLGATNHSNGTGLCASANDVASGPTSSWDAELHEGPLARTMAKAQASVT